MIGKKVAIIGLDGVPFSLLEYLFDSGLMPNLADLAKHGTFSKMTTSLPAVSSVAWSSFMTGNNPGEHGIFGFTELKRDEITLRLPSFDDIRRPAIWHICDGLNSIVVNLPFTYPARPLRGVLISGVVAPIFERAVYPQSLVDWLRSTNYRTDVDTIRARYDTEILFRDLFNTMNTHEEVMFALMSRQPWDLFIGVITGTDRLHHFLFDACIDSSHPRHRDCIDYYRRIDHFFGQLRQKVGAGTKLIVLSDHGFTSLKTCVQLNYVLKTLGYLRYTRTDPQSINDVHADSMAFALDPTRLYINSRERFKKGALNAHAASEVRARLREDLKRLHVSDVGIRDGADAQDNAPLFADVLFKEEIYHGDCLDIAPDLVVIPTRGYDVKASVGANAPTNGDIFTGMHTHDDAFLIISEASSAERLPEVGISDVAGLIIDALGDGRCYTLS